MKKTETTNTQDYVDQIVSDLLESNGYFKTFFYDGDVYDKVFNDGTSYYAVNKNKVFFIPSNLSPRKSS